MEERRDSARKTAAQRAVTATRTILTIPGRIFGWLVSGLAAWASWEVGIVALRHQPADFKLLLFAAALFLFAVAFAFPERTVKTLHIIADAWDRRN